MSNATTHTTLRGSLSSLELPRPKAIEPCGESPDSLTYRVRPSAASPGFLAELNKIVRLKRQEFGRSYARREAPWEFTVSKADLSRPVSWDLMGRLAKALAAMSPSTGTSDSLLRRWRDLLLEDARTTTSG